MFKSIIKTIIQALDTTLNELKRAYDETYGTSELVKEFKDRVDEIKEENKDAFIKAAIKVETINAIATREYPPPYEIVRRAKKRWKDALDNGELDELYNIRKELL